MERKKLYWEEWGVSVRYTRFSGNETSEIHAIFTIEPRAELFLAQMARFQQAYSLFMEEHKAYSCILKRYFLSDSANQQPLLPLDRESAVSAIQQPPLDGSKVAVWCYFVSHVTPSRDSQGLSFSHNGYTHYYHMSLCQHSRDSYTQTKGILEHYEQLLAAQGMNINDHCLRTWFFIRDVDTHYAGMVKARREIFMEQGLTEKTHYIASTGIEGKPGNVMDLVQMDAYAVQGLKNSQWFHLYASSHLNPTYEYGVTFERGTAVKYGDRTHVLISGTASIDNKGDVLYVGDVKSQCLRMWENVEMLLKEAQAGYEDVAQMIVYLRDVADYAQVREMFEKRFPDYPVVFTLAPVCRPAWLIEMECIAISPKGNGSYGDY